MRVIFSHIAQCKYFLVIGTLVLESVDTPRVFRNKIQDFTPKFLKPVVEVHLFLKGSK